MLFITRVSASIVTDVNQSIMRLVNHLCSKVLCVNYAYRNLHSVLLLSAGYNPILAYVYSLKQVAKALCVAGRVEIWRPKTRTPPQSQTYPFLENKISLFYNQKDRRLCE